MKNAIFSLFRPMTLFVTGTGLFVVGLSIAGNMPDITSDVALNGGALMIAGAIFWGLGALAMIVRLFKGGRPTVPTNPLAIAALSQTALQRAYQRKMAVFTAIIGAFVYFGIAAGVVLAVQPIADSYVLRHADPTMVALANEAGMSRKGKLVFLRAHPALVSDKEMQTDCSDNTAANNSDGFIEQGCFVPSTNRIYIRKLPANLHSLEVSTASYEMLHPVYIALRASSHGAALDAAIEKNFKTINDKNLNEQVANFAKTEPGARDLELFSLLGVGYSNLSSDLTAYYKPYFDNLGATVAANNKVEQLFKTDQDQLAQLRTQIDHYETLANDAYETSVQWAYAGNQAKDTYYYNLYRQYINQENALIDQYNKMLDSYNALVTEFNGTQPVQQLHPAGAQSQ